MEEKNGEHPFGDAGQIILFFLFMIIWILDSFIFQLSTQLAGTVPMFIRIILLVVCLVVGTILFRSGHVVVQREKRAEGVVSGGAFAYVRHPLYLGTILFYLGMSFLSLSLASMFIFIIIFLFYNHIATYEEILLEQKFGKFYTGYKNRTGKWFPKPKEK
jgi:protein-S-isoprenylcysteine O-methyltransferase Ste14